MGATGRIFCGDQEESMGIGCRLGAVALVALLAVPVGGCHQMIMEQIRRDTSERVRCPEARLQVSNYRTGAAGLSPSTWNAAGCDRRWSCELYATAAGSGLPDRMTCSEDEASRQMTIRKVAVDRLALESGCPKEAIRILAESEWSRGGEQAFRMGACGRVYVCTTAAGRTDCKAALPQAPAAPPHGRAPAGVP